jgi:ABC-type phosphate/phosphonate transport system substrate-binding protein
MTRRTFGLSALSALCVGGLAGRTGAAGPAAKEGLKIGVAPTLFPDMPAPMLRLACIPFKKYLGAQAGVAGDVALCDDVASLARKLDEKEIHFGVFHGFEFAWARANHPELKPLALAVKSPRDQHAVVLVRAEDPAASLADLKGKALAVAKGTREYCNMFISRACADCGGPGSHFRELTRPTAPASAIDGVAAGTYDAVLTDTIILEIYKRVKPKTFAKLKEVARSETFPPAVLAYRSGGVEPATAEGIRQCLVQANQNSDGRGLLSLWDLQRFEEPDAGYDAALERVLKAYPPPERTAAKQ